jgi:hypothetical protein
VDSGRKEIIGKIGKREEWIPLLGIEKKEPKHTQSSVGKIVYETGKKLFDSIDDAWAIARGFLGSTLGAFVGPTIIGSVGAIVHGVEGYKAFKVTRAAYRNRKTRQRKTKIATGAMASTIALTGFSLSASLLLKTLMSLTPAKWDTPEPAESLATVCIPGLLALLYGVNFAQQAYTFQQWKEEEKRLRIAYEEYVANHPADIEKEKALLAVQEAQLTQDILTLEKDKTADFCITNLHPSSPIDHLPGQKYTSIPPLVYEKKTDAVEHPLDMMQSSGAIKLELYQRAHHRRLKTEREAVFAFNEVLGATGVAAGFTLGTTELLGAAFVASLEPYPLALVIGGVVVGFGSKVFEFVDEHLKHRLTQGLRGLFAATGKPTFGTPLTEEEAQALLEAIAKTKDSVIVKPDQPSSPRSTTGRALLTLSQQSDGAPPGSPAGGAHSNGKDADGSDTVVVGIDLRSSSSTGSSPSSSPRHYGNGYDLLSGKSSTTPPASNKNPLTLDSYQSTPGIRLS